MSISNQRKSGKSLDIINYLIIFYIAGQLGLSILLYSSAEFLYGHISSGFFILWLILYWKASNRDIKAEKQNITKNLHLVVLATIAGQLLLSISLYWAEEFIFGHASTGLLIFWLILYWKYGLDYFEVKK